MHAQGANKGCKVAVVLMHGRRCVAIWSGDTRAHECESSALMHGWHVCESGEGAVDTIRPEQWSNAQAASASACTCMHVHMRGVESARKGVASSNYGETAKK